MTHQFHGIESADTLAGIRELIREYFFKNIYGK
jgi:hypothetical protein